MTSSSQNLSNQDKPTSNILRWPQVYERVGLCRSQVHNLVSAGKFPSPIKLGLKASGWLEEEIDEWIQERIEVSRTIEK